MHKRIKAALSANDWMGENCSNCGCPQFEIFGDTDSGITSVNCPDCGQHTVRMDTRMALRWYAYALLGSIDAGDDEGSTIAMASLRAIWLDGGSLTYGGFFWVVIREGSSVENHHEPAL